MAVMTREEIINGLYDIKNWECNGNSKMYELIANAIKALEQEPTTKNDLGVDCISRAELLKAMDTWDKFGYTETGCFVREPKGDYVPYVHYEDMVNCVKGVPSVTPQELIRSVLEDIKAEIPNLVSYESSDGQDLILADDMATFIDRLISGKEVHENNKNDRVR